MALVAASATLRRAQRRLRLHIETGGTVRDVQTLTLFVGNNRLQLQQFGAEPADTLAGTPGDGSMAALMLRPIGTLSMIGLMLRGALGPLGDAQSVAHFEFDVASKTRYVEVFPGRADRVRQCGEPVDSPVLLLGRAQRDRHAALACLEAAPGDVPVAQRAPDLFAQHPHALALQIGAVDFQREVRAPRRCRPRATGLSGRTLGQRSGAEAGSRFGSANSRPATMMARCRATSYGEFLKRRS